MSSTPSFSRRSTSPRRSTHCAVSSGPSRGARSPIRPRCWGAASGSAHGDPERRLGSCEVDRCSDPLEPPSLVPTLAQLAPDGTRFEAQHLADPEEGEHPGTVVAPQPALRFAKHLASPRRLRYLGFGVDRDRVFEDGSHQTLLAAPPAPLP